MDTKPSHIWFNKVDKFIKMYDGIRYLVMYDCNRYNAIYYMIRYLISEKSSIENSINQIFARIIIDS